MRTFNAPQVAVQFNDDIYFTLSSVFSLLYLEPSVGGRREALAHTGKVQRATSFYSTTPIQLFLTKQNRKFREY
jgi:hypothetical protein